MKKVAVVGSRDYYNKQESRAIINRVLDEIGLTHQEIEIVSGLARGADTLGEEFAYDFNIRFHPFPADWDKFGKAAGYIRNGEMAQVSDYVIAFWDGKSRGTKNMIQSSYTSYGCEVWIWNYIEKRLIQLKQKQ